MPTPEMRHAMATVPLGDDVFGDDPMVNELEHVSASMLGKEAAVFLPSGTMGNVVGGARIFNASVAAGTDVADIAACGDTVTFCLSKGLGCPAGSVFCGSAESVQEARRWRKRLGGAMRQAGVIAATGVIALRTMVDRLADDHSNARTLAEGLAELPGVRCDLSRVQTNLVFFDLATMTGANFEAECATRGILR